MAIEVFVDLTYRGIELGRRVRVTGDAGETAYLSFNAPMPVGTELVLTTGDGAVIPVNVIEVQEQVSGAARPPGMRVEPGDLDAEARSRWIALLSGSSDDPDSPAVS